MFNGLNSKIQDIETPFYIYDIQHIEKNIDDLKSVFSDFAELFFAVKANTSLQILKKVMKKKMGAEVVSAGEIYSCLKAGFNPEKILYNNIARKEEDIEYALKSGLIFFNFEAMDQAVLLDRYARKMNKKIKIFVRINPGIFSKTHPHLSTGSYWSKFGIEMDELDEVVELNRNLENSELVGIHYHIGSQILSPLPFIKATGKAREAINYFEKNGIEIKYLNLGGGFGIPYETDEMTLDFRPVADAYRKMSEECGVQIFLEPGRFIVGEAGYLVTRVISRKNRNGMPLYIVDAGMAENPRPVIYGAYHHIEPLNKNGKESKWGRVAGSLCENSDEFGIYNMPELDIGDTLIIHNCGAYTRTMASNYNGRLLPAEFIMENNQLRKIRKRQDFENLIEKEVF